MEKKPKVYVAIKVKFQFYFIFRYWWRKLVICHRTILGPIIFTNAIIRIFQIILPDKKDDRNSVSTYRTSVHWILDFMVLLYMDGRGGIAFN